MRALRRWRVIAPIVAATAVGLISACAPTPSGPGFESLPSPTPDSVVQVTTANGQTSRRPMSSDGGVVAYSAYNADSGVTDAHLWIASTGSTQLLTNGSTEGAPRGALTDPPFVSSDGSTVVFTSTLPTVGGQTNTGNSVFRHSVASGVTQQIEVPATFGAGPIESVSSSGDGSLLVVSYGNKVLTWTAADGLDELTDPARLLSGDAFAFSAVGAAVSDNGRYVSVISHVATTFNREPGMCIRIEVHDLVTTDVAPGDCFEKSGLYPPDLPFWAWPILATTDDGGAVYGEMNIGVRSWSPTDGGELMTNRSVYPAAASPDGGAFSYATPTAVLAGSPGTGYLRVREPAGRATLGQQRYATSAVGIGADATTVLLSSREPAIVGAGPEARDALYLWTRSG